VTRDGLSGLDERDLDFGFDLSESLTSSAKSVRECVQYHRDHVLSAAFVFQIQPLDPDLVPLVIFAQSARDGRARGECVALLRELKRIRRLERVCDGRRSRL
jgi:hypothetical protein